MELIKIRNSIRSDWEKFVETDIELMEEHKPFHGLEWGPQISYDENDDCLYFYTGWTYLEHYMEDMVGASEDELEEFLCRGVDYLQGLYGENYDVSFDYDSEVGYHGIMITMESI